MAKSHPVLIWRPGSESNRLTRICSPLHNHSATRPCSLNPNKKKLFFNRKKCIIIPDKRRENLKIKNIPIIMAFIPSIVFAADDDCMSRRNVPNTVMTLQQVVEMGLCRNPETASAYYSLESARLNKNAGYASYLPSVNASASVGKSYQNEHWGDVAYGASISASYLIFDFGKRTADMNQMIAAYRAAGFDYDENIQNFDHFFLLFLRFLLAFVIYIKIFFT